MKAHELRINNRVIVNGKVITVESVDQFGINIYTNCDIEAFDYDGYFDVAITNNNPRHSVHKIEPIELTEELLLRLGFFENNSYSDIGEVLYYIGEFGTYLDGQVWWNDEIISNNIKYVHQLQNLYFSLTGKDLIINN
jgi:hypothetical protein